MVIDCCEIGNGFFINSNLPHGVMVAHQILVLFD